MFISQSVRTERALSKGCEQECTLIIIMATAGLGKELSLIDDTVIVGLCHYGYWCLSE